MNNDSPTTPRDAYRRIIDECVDDTPGITAKSLVGGPPFQNDAEIESLLVSLTQSQREALARLFDSEREEAMHDLLSRLTWWIECAGLALTLNGEPVPVDESGMGLHGDYIGRLQDWDWPDLD